MQRLRPLSEQECYLRCYGQRSEDAVRVVRAAPPAPAGPSVFAERVRAAFERRLEPSDRAA